MTFRVDRMSMEDVPEVMAIERESFLTPWPASAYRRELNENRNAHYLVLRLGGEQDRQERTPALQTTERRSFWSGLFSLSRTRDPAPAPPEQQTMAGYAGLWLMVDEAHITTIAIRPKYRGRGLGELMLVALTEIAFDIEARWLTLEVRVSNGVAQALYRKYGFKPAGVRQRYYSDNQEDALIMWTDELQSVAFQERFASLREGLRRRLIGVGDLSANAGQRTAPPIF